jgi:hypothetical protein
MMKFTHDWFSHNIPNFQVVKQLIPECKSILEIGCYEGRATCWMLENLLANDGSISCVDTFQGSEEHQNMDFITAAVVAMSWLRVFLLVVQPHLDQIC